jgi:hypothetical protein
VLREAFSIETTRIPPTTPATQRKTCSLGNAAVCAPPFAIHETLNRSKAYPR